MPDANEQAEEERAEFSRAFRAVASFQGRFAYCLMSIHAVNPQIFELPCLRPLIPAQRISLSLLASLSFNYSSLQWYEWLAYTFAGRPYLLTSLGYLSGRIMMVHLLAFLYHIDTRCTEPDSRPRRDPLFEAMYL